MCNLIVLSLEFCHCIVFNTLIKVVYNGCALILLMYQSPHRFFTSIAILGFHIHTLEIQAHYMTDLMVITRNKFYIN